MNERVTFGVESELTGNTLSGIAHTFGSVTERNGQYLRFAVGAFDNALKTSDARAYWNHDNRLLLGRESAGTLRLHAENDGLHFSVDLPETSYAQDLKALISRKDVTEMSFGITSGQVKFSKASDGKTIVDHVSVGSIFDISPVSTPAFVGGSNIQLHSLYGEQESLASQLVKARHRALIGANTK